MKLTHVAMVIGGIWMLQRWASARAQQNKITEQMPTDPYSAVTNIWEALNGSNLTGRGTNPNAHPALIDYTAGQTCHCPGEVGVK